MRCAQTLGDEAGELHAQGLVSREAEHAQAGRIDHDDALLLIDRDHRLQRRMRQPCLHQGLHGQENTGHGMCSHESGVRGCLCGGILESFWQINQPATGRC
ncbi:hypothetical protein D9M68_716860 [compost metagenome]